MGTLETQSGNLSRARPLLEQAAADEPSVEVLSTLAAIDRQRKRPDLALRSLNTALELSRKDGDLIAQTELLLKSFEIHRSTKDASTAKRTLADALSKALDARALARSAPNQARTERLLARVLELYGHEEGARRATERAYEAARSDVRQMAATVLDASRRALTLVDLTEAREALHRALQSNLEAEDLVYVALWLQLVEQQLKVSSDGSTEEAEISKQRNSQINLCNFLILVLTCCFILHRFIDNKRHGLFEITCIEFHFVMLLS
jgi:tetratricopeptide (TPR) repeat protein